MVHETNLQLQRLHLTGISLTKLDALTLGQLQNTVHYLAVQLRVCRERDVLFLNRAVYHHLLHLLLCNLRSVYLQMFLGCFACHLLNYLQVYDCKISISCK